MTVVILFVEGYFSSFLWPLAQWVSSTVTISRYQGAEAT